MGKSFGSPTGKYGWYEEEFFDALNSYRERGLPRIGFFFRIEQISTSDLSASLLEQLDKIQRFKSEIGALGLYREFAEDHQLSINITNLVANALDADAPDGVISSTSIHNGDVTA